MAHLVCDARLKVKAVPAGEEEVHVEDRGEREGKGASEGEYHRQLSKEDNGPCTRTRVEAPWRAAAFQAVAGRRYVGVNRQAAVGVNRQAALGGGVGVWTTSSRGGKCRLVLSAVAARVAVGAGVAVAASVAVGAGATIAPYEHRWWSALSRG